MQISRPPGPTGASTDAKAEELVGLFQRPRQDQPTRLGSRAAVLFAAVDGDGSYPDAFKRIHQLEARNGALRLQVTDWTFQRPYEIFVQGAPRQVVGQRQEKIWYEDHDTGRLFYVTTFQTPVRLGDAVVLRNQEGEERAFVVV